MTDPIPIDVPTPGDRAPDLDRAAKIDELLLAGLDHYFGGRFQDAIDIWGRVLFLDRGHAGARAYIERARGALAERQRKTEELVGEGVAALDRGDGLTARQLLSRAVENGDPHDLARPHLERLNRLSSQPPAARRLRWMPHAAPRAEQEADAGPAHPPRPVRALPIIGVTLLVGIVIVVAASRDWLRPLVARSGRPVPAAPVVAYPPEPELLPVPSPAEIALARSRELYSGGHVKAALSALDGVPDADPLAPEAIRLRADLQRTLLGASAERDEAAAGAPQEARSPEARR
jgi:hypothetical protein